MVCEYIDIYHSLLETGITQYGMESLYVFCGYISYKGCCSWQKHISYVTERIYRKISNIRRTLVGNEIVDHSDVVGAWPVGAAPTTSSFST